MSGRTRGVKITTAAGERRPVSPRARWTIIALGWILASTGVLLGSRLVAHAGAGDAASVPATSLDAHSARADPSADAAPTDAAPTGAADPGAGPTDEAPPTADRRVAESTRLLTGEPRVLLDSRARGALPAGTELTVPLPGLSTGAAAVLAEVSILAAGGPGEVTVGSGERRTTVLRVAKARAQQSATVVAYPDPEGGLRVGVTGGGHLLVRLIGTFEPAERSGAGRIVPVPATRVVRLVPRTDGKRTRVTLSDVPELADAGPISAVLLQVSADVGPRGGYVAAGPAADRLNQTVYWSATSGRDRTRTGLMVVPVTGDSVHLRYHAGTELRVDLVGYVTGAGAPESVAGLAVPVVPQAAEPVRVAGGSAVDVSLSDATTASGVPADRVAAALVTLEVVGDGVGEVRVGASGADAPARPTLTAPNGVARVASTLVRADDAAVRVDSAVDASVTVTPTVLVLTG